MKKNFVKQKIKYLRENGILIAEIALAISTKSKPLILLFFHSITISNSNLL